MCFVCYDLIAELTYDVFLQKKKNQLESFVLWVQNTEF